MEANGLGGLLSDKPDHELFAELQKGIFGDKTLPGNSADLIREAREIRDAETDSTQEVLRTVRGATGRVLGVHVSTFGQTRRRRIQPSRGKNSSEERCGA